MGHIGTDDLGHFTTGSNVPRNAFLPNHVEDEYETVSYKRLADVQCK